MDTAQWISHEFKEIKFGDIRLHRRFLKVASDLSRQPGSSTNAACSSWGDTKAAYRLFNNEKVSTQTIVGTHIERSCARASAFSTVLAVQDTCYLDFKSHKKTQGLGKINNARGEAGEGLIMHSSYLLSPTGLPLGFGFQKIWARKGQPRQIQKTEQWLSPIEEKESYKWLESMIHVQKRFTDVNTKVVNICDREADVYELFCEAQRSQTQFIVRSRHDRSVNRTTRQAASGQALSQLLRGSQALGNLEIQLSARGDRPAREAKVELRCVTAIVSAPTDKKGYKDSYTEDVEVKVVEVLEQNAPEGVEPLHWVLLTNLEVSNFDQAQLIAQWYSYRWRIEEFHRILKSGCKAEDCRLQSATRLIKHISLMTVIAWRIHWLTKIAREAGQTPCSKVLGESEWRGLCVVVLKDKKLLQKPPSLTVAIRAIASLGGFLGRKSDREPGPETIWKGLKALYHIAQTLEALA